MPQGRGRKQRGIFVCIFSKHPVNLQGLGFHPSESAPIFFLKLNGMVPKSENYRRILSERYPSVRP